MVPVLSATEEPVLSIEVRQSAVSGWATMFIGSAAIGGSYGLPVLGGIAALIVVGLVVVVRRSSQKNAAPPATIRQERPGNPLSRRVL